MPNKKPPGSPEGRVEAQRRRLILDAAAAVVAEGGAESLTLRKVAQRARVTTGMITYYFPSKDDLMISTLNESAQRVRDRVDEVQGTTLDKVRRSFEVALTEPTSEGANWPFWLEYAAKAARTPELLRFHAERLNTARHWHTLAIQKLVDARELDSSLEPRLVADMLLALYQGLLMEVTLDREQVPPERGLAILDMVLDALRPRTTSADHHKQEHAAVASRRGDA